MAYSLPDFNLTIGHFRSFAPYSFSTKTSLGTFMGQLRGYGAHPRVTARYSTTSVDYPSGWSVLCPPATDLRDALCSSASFDLLEIPSASGRWYIVNYVDDIARGFPNQYRLGILEKLNINSPVSGVPFWPSPIP